MSEIHNLIIIGSGPSGWAAATYTARAQLNPLVIAGEKSGGQLMLTTEVENYPGFPQGIQGPELMANMRQQAERFGANVIDLNAVEVDFSTSPFKICVYDSAIGNNGKREYLSHAVIVSTGAVSQMLGIPGEREFLGRGVSTCAVCDAAFFKGKRTFVVGGGDAAMEDALALTKFAEQITLVHRRDSFRASKIMQQRVLEEHQDKVSVLWNTEVVEVKGNDLVEKIVLKNTQTGATSEVAADGFFIAIGHKPATEIFRGQIMLDEKGYVVTRLGLGKQSVALAQSHLKEDLVQHPTMTSVEGVFAAGDVVDFRYRQAITAAGYGTMAALDAEWWLERVQGIEVI